MAIVLLGARLLLAAVFVVAALAKVADRAGARQALRQCGVPARLIAPLGLLLPLAELTIACALVPPATAWDGAIGALALLLLFSGASGYNLARGRTPDWRYVGQLGAEPVGPPTLIPNLMLALVAGIIVWQGRTDPGLSAVAWLGTLSLTQAVALIAGVGLAMALVEVIWVLIQVLRQQERLLVRLEGLERQLAANAVVPPAVARAEEPSATPGLPVGTVAPSFALSGLYGETLTLDALCAPGKPVVLVFSDPGYGPCTALLPEIGRWQREHAAALTLAVVSRGTPEANRTTSSEHRVSAVLLQEDREVMQAYQSMGTPAAVVVRPDGTIASPLAQGADAIRALVARTAGGSIPWPIAPTPANGGGQHAGTAPPAMPPAPKIGDPVPALVLDGDVKGAASPEGRRRPR
jgi:peroxiredoxin